MSPHPSSARLTAYAADPSWPLVAVLVVLAAVLTVVGLVLLVRTRGGRS